ncbi:hypothetical protein [Clostridium sp. M14]|uniref:hypothetical protein n=1 Tax=Clostridium sp. M14 TaxID=2716311 RepID=UPI0013EE6259|nr:hypothetical protein [Clostridium sp. M14]MBZ9693338.1 hypothetical protein [Clostridium sp. M14]
METKLLKKNNRFELREIEVTKDLAENLCEICEKSNEEKLYWLKGEHDNFNGIMCKECIEKLKSIVNYFE